MFYIILMGCISLESGAPDVGVLLSHPLKLVKQAASIEAGIFSIDYSVPPSDVSGNHTVTAFVIMVESEKTLHYLMLVGLYTPFC